MKTGTIFRRNVIAVVGSLLVAAFMPILLTGCRGGQSKYDESAARGRIVRSAIDYYEMGRNLEKAGNYPSALDKYRESIKISPRPVAYYALGSLEGQLLEFEKAKVNLREALELSPGFGAARRELERIEAMEKLMERGEPIPEALREKPLPPTTRGDEETPGEPDSVSAAEADVPSSTPAKTAPEVREVPPKPPAPDPRESVMQGTSPPDLTAQEVPPPAETLSEEDEIRVRVLLREARILLEDGAVDEAIDVYQEGLLEFPRVGRIHASLGYAYQTAGSFRAALLAYEDAIRLGYSSPVLYNNLGVVYESLGKSRLAEKSYRKSIEMGGFPDAHYNLAVLLDKRGEAKAALLEYEAYIALDPEGKLAEGAQAQADRLRRSVR